MAILHAAHGYRVDTITGEVVGMRGKPVGSKDSSGYLQIDARPQCGRMISAHRMVWEAMNGAIPVGMEINHRNGIKTDNRPDNLELVTHAENIQHAYANGLKSNAGEKHPSAVLTEDMVREIRRTYIRRKVTAQMIADRLGIGRKAVSDVVCGRTWAEVV